jgi:AraC-like DNA-binding protein
MGPTSVQRFSTDAVDPTGRVGYWNALASETFNNLVVDPVSREDFRGEMVRAPLGGMTLMSARSAPAQVSRTNDATRAARGLKAFDLHFQLEGRSLNSQDGREAVLEAGDFTLCDASRPYRVRFAEPNHMLCLKMPAELLAARLGDVESLVCAPMSGRSGGAAMLSAFLRSLWHQLDSLGGDEDCRQTVGGVVLDLLDLAYRPLRSEAQDASLRRARLRQAHAYIDSRLCDPALSVGAIAEALGVSPRYVQMLFAEAGATPSAYVLDRRLELAARRLAQGVGRGGVTEVALGVGFNDVTHFGRAFRRRFGVSPSDYSSGARPSPWQVGPLPRAAG